MVLRSTLYRLVSLSEAAPLCSANLRSIAELTAGVIIPSIPATNVVYRHLKPTFSSHTLGLSQKLKSLHWSRTPSENITGDMLEMGSARNHYQVINENPIKLPSTTIRPKNMAQLKAKDNASA